MTVRRIKTYASSQGYVYQYYFVGQRAVANSPIAGTEYIFDVTSDRKTTIPLRIVLPGSVVTQWAVAHGRDLTGPEQYAAAKMQLFKAFDEMDRLLAPGCTLTLSVEILEALLGKLGVE
jgi:hypothetical protein